MGSKKAKRRITNRDLNTLLINLGFQVGDSTEKFHRIWRHPNSDATIILPANKEDDPPLEANLHSVRTHLDYNGHMDVQAFDEFVRTGKLAVS